MELNLYQREEGLELRLLIRREKLQEKRQNHLYGTGKLITLPKVGTGQLRLMDCETLIS